MLNQIKVYIYGTIAALFAGLLVLLKIRNTQTAKAKDDVKIEKVKTVEAQAATKQVKEVMKAAKHADAIREEIRASDSQSKRDKLRKYAKN